jgi:hypothetical protein
MTQPYFNKDGFSLYLSDCLALLGKLTENFVDMVFADPLHISFQAALSPATAEKG